MRVGSRIHAIEDCHVSNAAHTSWSGGLVRVQHSIELSAEVHVCVGHDCGSDLRRYSAILCLKRYGVNELCLSDSSELLRTIRAVSCLRLDEDSGLDAVTAGEVGSEVVEEILFAHHRLVLVPQVVVGVDDR
jgi:hypothetical protein